MPSDDSLFADVQRIFAERWKERGKSLESDKKKRKLTPEYRKTVDTWLARLNAAKKTYEAKSAPKTLDADVEAAHAALHHDLDAIAMWWNAMMGGAFAIRAFSKMWGIDWFGIERYNYINDNDQHPEFPVARDGVGEWRSIKAAIDSCNAKERAAARKEAESIRARAPLALRCTLDFIFPEEGTWADEDAAALLAGKEAHFEYLFGRSTEFVAALLTTRASRENRDKLAAMLANWRPHASIYGTAAFVGMAIAMHGNEAVSQVATLLAKSGGDQKKELAEELAKVKDSIEVARIFAAGLEDKLVRGIAQTYLEAHPAIAKTVLEEIIARHGKVAEAAARLLVRVAPETKRAAVAEAKTSALPRVLSDPPWLAKKPKTKLPSVANLKALSYKEQITWKAGEREKAAEPGLELELLRNWNDVPKKARPRSGEMDAHILKKLKAAGDGSDFFKQMHYASTYLHAMSDKAALRAWLDFPPKAWGVYTDDVLYTLARFDVAGLPGWLAVAGSMPQKAIETAEHVDSHRIAPAVADMFRFTKRAAAPARKWLITHPEAAAIALIPLALLADEKKRNAPCAALRAIDAGGHGDVVRAVAKKYGEDAQKGVEAVLAFDPLDDYPDKLPKLPDFFDASALPAPVLKSGGALPASAITAIATMLAFSHPLDPYPGLVAVKEACDARSLAEFAWALFQEWMLADSPSKSDWAMMALAHFGDDEIARNLTPKIREWPGTGGHARAVKGLDVLAVIGSDVAIMHLDRIAQKLKFKGLQEKAREKMLEVAEARGLTPDELGDRIAPTLDLDADGHKTLSFGARSFRVSFDADLKPCVTGDDGKRASDLPKPGKSDDPPTAKASLETWKALKKDAKTVAAQQLFRFEKAMCTARKWDSALFRTFLVDHPLVSHVARRLVWTDGKRTFRVAEDRTLSDDADKTFELAADASVMIPHTLALDAKAIATWSKIFGDYEILQPFAQLARDTYAPTAAEKSGSKIDRWPKLKVATGRVLHLADRGWRRGFAQDAGWIWDMKKDIAEGVTAELAIGGGILAGDLRESPPEQELDGITLTKKVSELDPISFSELVRDVELLKG